MRTAFGSDRGQVVVPPGSVELDFLRFEGARARDVEDVRVEVAGVEPVAAPRVAQDVEVQRFDRRGRPVEMADFFDSFRVTNPADDTVAIRVALLEYEEPPPGEAQQAIRVTQVTPLLRLKSGAQQTFTLPPKLRGRVDRQPEAVQLALSGARRIEASRRSGARSARPGPPAGSATRRG